MTKTDKARIESAVKAVYARTKINEFPIDIDSVYRCYDISVIKYSDLPYVDIIRAVAASEDGFCGQINGHYVVFYNDSVSEVRIRFTLMHELGHIVLGHDKQGRREEAEANYFASQMLVPDSALEYMLATVTKGNENTVENIVEQITAGFRVSTQCAKITYHRYIKKMQEKPRRL
ncbi:MAG: ImmA/IrrE family metallo-endopeptidase [Clostridia bacterium]|nr:ImmA/IrrE family metallo-endopeptidase [Clostridia bacterium]